MRAWIIGLLLSCPLACAAASTPIQPTSPLAALLKSQAIDSTYAISYRDEHGRPLSEAAFSTRFAQGRSFDLHRDDAGHTAVLSLLAKDQVPPSFAKELAATHANAAGTSFLQPGQALPAFQLQTADGHQVDNASLRGHLTLVNFFFSECGPCIAETPTLVAYAKKHPQQHVLAVTFDDAPTAKAFVADHGFSWPVLVDGMAFDQAMGVDVYPVMALVGPDGRLLKMGVAGNIARTGKPLGVGDLEAWVAAPHPRSR